MQFAVDIAPLGPLADPQVIARLAAAAESAGWDGISVWDSLGTSMGAEAADPFVALTAVASATERLRLIASVVAMPRRRPQLVSQAAATLDRWSGGRLTLGLGSGGDPGDFEPFGESFDPRRRAAMLGEAAGIVDRLLRGETVDVSGAYYSLHAAGVGPRPAQDPRPPIWIGGMKPGALRRAGRWDGWIAITIDESGALALRPEELARSVGTIREERMAGDRSGEPFDVAVFGMSEFGDSVTDWTASGATWWLESLSPLRGPIDQLLERITAGPPRSG